MRKQSAPPTAGLSETSRGHIREAMVQIDNLAAAMLPQIVEADSCGMSYPIAVAAVRRIRELADVMFEAAGCSDAPYTDDQIESILCRK